MPGRSFAARMLLLLGLVGLAVSIVMLYVHHQVSATGGTYASFCNVSERVNCDAVLGSEYADFLGIPVAAWAAATYVTLVVVAVIPGLLAAYALATIGGIAAGYSLVMAFVSFAVLERVCLLCATLYLVNTGVLALAWAQARSRIGGRAAIAAVLGPLTLSVAIGTAAVGYDATWGLRGSQPLTAAEIAAREPDFYRWYMERPVASAALRDTRGPVHSRGDDKDATVTVIEFSDFACSHCAHAYRAFKNILSRNPDVRLIFRHFPLDKSCNETLSRQVHPWACKAAIAAECAGQQGKFWEYHDYLFENQIQQDYTAAAVELGLDGARFRACLAADDARETVLRNIEQGNDLGVESTPTTYLNGRAVQGALRPALYGDAIIIERAHARAASEEADTAP